MAKQSFNDRMIRRLGAGPNGDPTLQPLQLPGMQPESTRELLDVFESLPKGSSINAPPPTSLTPADKARADYLAKEFLEMIRNTNITASLPAHDSPMLWSNVIDKSVRYVLPAGITAYVPVIRFTSPPGRAARISAYGVDVDGSFTYDDSILWQLTLNGQPIQDLYDWGLHRGSLIQPSSTFIVVPEGQTITFEVRRAVAALVSSNVDMVLKGWTWRLRNDYEGTKSSVTAF